MKNLHPIRVEIMWSETVRYLKDPALVARIQQFFGVQIHYPDLKERRKESHDANTRNVQHDLNSCLSKSDESRENGYVTTEKKLADTAGTCATDRQQDVFNSNYTVTNYFWYYLFLFGTELGDEIFYSTFIPFWFWNIDCFVGRRVILIWAVVMSTGQILKDVVCWARPACPPAVRLQVKWSEEYGMPSTHAMIGLSIPLSVLLFTMHRYTYPLSLGCTIATLWCTLVCTSRLYLGMHTALDILAGIVLATVLMIPLIYLVDITDYYIISNVWAVTTLIVISIFVIVYYPCSKKWTPTRGDTTMVVSVTTGVYLGAWLNYTSGYMVAPATSPPYHITWPSYSAFGCLILRTILGFCSILATRAVCKSFSYGTMCAILKINSKDLIQSKNYSEDKNKVLVDLVHKYVTCFMIGIDTVYLLPNVFSMMGIERPSFYTEI